MADDLEVFLIHAVTNAKGFIYGFSHLLAKLGAGKETSLRTLAADAGTPALTLAGRGRRGVLCETEAHGADENKTCDHGNRVSGSWHPSEVYGWADLVIK